MNARNFADVYRRKLEVFMEEVEAGTYKPLGLKDPEQFTQYEWWELFQNWLAEKAKAAA